MKRVCWKPNNFWALILYIVRMKEIRICFSRFYFILYFTVARVISIQTHSHKMLHIGNKAECITHHRWFRCANKLKARIFFISISRKFHRYGNHLYGISDKQKHKKRSNTSSSSTLPMMYHGITVHLIA